MTNKGLILGLKGIDKALKQIVVIIGQIRKSINILIKSIK